MILDFDKDYVVYDYANIPKRLLARILDILIIGIISAKVTNFQIGVYLAIFFSVFQYIYSILLTYFFRQTVGMFIVRAKVISTKGERLSLRQAVIRALCGKVSDFFIGAGDIWILFNDSNQTWHDILASTIVINRESHKEIEEHIKKYPWPNPKKLNVLRIIALTISVFLFCYSSLSKLVNDFGKLGLSYIKTYETSQNIASAKIYSSKNEKQLYTLAVSDKTKIIDIYTSSKEGIALSKTVKLEDVYPSVEITSLSFSAADMDGDGKSEIILSQIIKSGEKIISELAIYKDESSKLSLIDKVVKSDKDVGFYQSNIATIEGEDKKNYIVWANNQELGAYIFQNSKLTLTNKGYLPSTNSTIVYSDFDGNGEKQLYAIQQGSKNLLEVSTLEHSSNFQIEPYISVTDTIDYMEKIYMGKIISGDINNDGRDELIVIDKENGVKGRKLLERKEPAWLNVYSKDDSEWKKIWTGGNINEKLMDKYIGNADIDEDGVNEIIMTHDSNINIYKHNSILFKLNSLWQRIIKMQDKLMIGVV